MEGLKCGADDYLTKPFKRSELAARIRAHIRARDAISAQQAAEQQWALAHNLLPMVRALHACWRPAWAPPPPPQWQPL